MQFSLDFFYQQKNYNCTNYNNFLIFVSSFNILIVLFFLIFILLFNWYLFLLIILFVYCHFVLSTVCLSLSLSLILLSAIDVKY